MSTNPLVVGPSGNADPFTGINVLSDGEGIVGALSSGSWVEGALSTAGMAGDVADFVSNPFGKLAGELVGWLISHINPLKKWFDELAGSPGEVQAAAGTWHNIQAQLVQSGSDLTSSVKGLSDQTSDAMTNYRTGMASAANHLGLAGELAGGIATGLGIAAGIVSVVHDLVLQAIKDVVSVVVGAWVPTPGLFANVANKVRYWVGTVGPKIKELTTSFEKLTALIQRVEEIFTKVKGALGKLARRTEDMPASARAAIQKARDALQGARKAADDAVARIHEKLGVTSPNRAASEPGLCGASGEPVDMATGQWFVQLTDLTVDGALPLKLTRTHASGYRAGRSFGATWCSPLDERLEFSGDEVDYLRGDASMLVYDLPGDEPTMPHAGRWRWPLRRLDDGRFTVTDPLTGVERRFVQLDAERAFLAEVVDRAGNWQSIVRNELGEPQAVLLSGGQQVRLGWSDHRVTSVWLAAGADDASPVLVRQFAYTDGLPTHDWDATRQVMRFEYDAEGRVVTWIDRVNLPYLNRYDEQGRVVWQGTPDDSAQAFSFEYGDERADGTRVVASIDAYGHRHEFVYNQADELIAEVDEVGATTEHLYDEFSRRIATTDPLGRITRFDYDEVGHLVRLDQPDGTSVSASYDAAGNPVQVREADGSLVRQEFDAHGLLVRQVDAAGGATVFEHDQRGHLSAVVDALGLRTSVRCDASGLPVQLTTADGATTLVRRDAFGRVIEVVDPIGGVTRQDFTPEGWLWRRQDPTGATETWTYNAEGSMVGHTDALGRETRLEYGPFEVMTARIEPDGTRYEFEYDDNSRLVRVHAGDMVWHYERDAAGRVVAETDFDGRTVRYDLDAAGQPVRVKSPSGVATHEFDAMGRLVRRMVDGVEDRRRFDPMGRLVEATRADVTLSREYDVVGNLLAETVDGRSTRWGHDAVGQVTSRVTPAGTASEMAWTADGSLASVTLAGHETVWQRDAMGREVERRAPGLQLTSQWDAASRLVGRVAEMGAARGISGPAGASVGASAGRAADVAGERWQVSYARNVVGDITEIRDSAAGVTAIGLDFAGRVTGARGPQGAESYRYDALGRISEARWGASQTLEPDAEGERAYVATRVERVGRDRLAYDEAGRLVRRERRLLSGGSRVWTYEWDSDYQLVGLVTPTGDRWRYRYDPLGRRIAKDRLDVAGLAVEQVVFVWDGPQLAEQSVVVDGCVVSSTTWVHDGWAPVAQAVVSGAGADVVPGGGADEPVDVWSQERVDAEFFSIVTDMVGAPVRVVDADGRLAWVGRRTVFGLEQSSGLMPLRFPGQYADDESGMFYNLFRYYDPSSGRYLSPDPLGLAPSPDPMGYPANPLQRFDPLGLHVVDESGAANAAAYQRYLDELRAQMGKPSAEDPVLAGLIDGLYRPGASIGNGSTADAVRYEMAHPGAKVGGKEHVQKAQDTLNRLARWLRRQSAAGTQSASAQDVRTAENLFIDLANALEGR